MSNCYYHQHPSGYAVLCCHYTKSHLAILILASPSIHLPHPSVCTYTRQYIHLFALCIYPSAQLCDGPSSQPYPICPLVHRLHSLFSVHSESQPQMHVSECHDAHINITIPPSTPQPPPSYPYFPRPKLTPIPPMPMRHHPIITASTMWY